MIPNQATNYNTNETREKDRAGEQGMNLKKKKWKEQVHKKQEKKLPNNIRLMWYLIKRKSLFSAHTHNINPDMLTITKGIWLFDYYLKFQSSRSCIVFFFFLLLFFMML